MMVMSSKTLNPINQPFLSVPAGALPREFDDRWLDEMVSNYPLLHGRDDAYQPFLLTRLLLRHHGYECIPFRSTSGRCETDKTANTRWSIDYGIKEIPGEIESAIALWWHSQGTPFTPSPSGSEGLCNMAMSVAALSVEKALKTLLKITSPGTAVPRGKYGHDMHNLWCLLPRRVQSEVQGLMYNLPPSWEGVPRHESPEAPIGECLHAMKVAFNDYRYMPETFDNPPAWYAPAALIKIAGSVYVACLKHYAELLSTTDSMQLGRLCWSKWCSFVFKHRLRPSSRVVSVRTVKDGDPMDEYTLVY